MPPTSTTASIASATPISTTAEPVTASTATTANEEAVHGRHIESLQAKRAKEEAKRLAHKYVLPDGSVPSVEAFQSAIADAAKLDRTAYELERRHLAEEHAVRVDFLDEAVAEVREDAEVEPFLALDPPWDEAVSGTELLDEVYGTILKDVTMPKHAALACALWGPTRSHP